MKLLFLLLALPMIGFAQNVYIPNANFKAYLVGNTAINTNGDNQIQVSEASVYNGAIYCSFMNISNLTGIEAFVSLTSLSCYNNQLTSLDVSSCTALATLQCTDNQLTSLDVSSCTALATLQCTDNQLISLNVSGCTLLNYLVCYVNQLTSLDVSSCTALTNLDCFGNNLTSLNVSSCTALTHLVCDYNQLSSLDVSSCTALTNLDCDYNQLTSLNVSSCTALTHLWCRTNNLTSLDVSTCTSLYNLNCINNQLTSLDVKNGINIYMEVFLAYNNPNLSCIKVDDVAFSNTNWVIYVDTTAFFSLTCAPPTAAVLSGTATICAGSSTNLSVAVTGGTDLYTVTLSDGTNNYSATGASPVSISVSPTATSTYTIVSVTGGGSGTGNNGTAIVTVTTNSTNTTTLTACDSYLWNGTNYTASGVYTGPTTNCVTQSLNLTITPSAINTISSSVCPGFPYIWNNQSYSTSGSYTQTFQASNGCDSNVTLNLTVYPTNFNPVFSSTQQLFTSPPFAVQFSNTTANIGSYNFTWYWGDGTSSASNNSTVFHEYLNNGLYTITLVATNTITGCSDETTYTDYIYATGGVGCLHSASINQTGPINACSGQPVLLTCNSNPNFTYQWRNNGVYISGNNNDSLYVSQTGSYSVIISFNGCPVASGNVVVNLQSIEQPTINSSGSIQPCIGGSVTLTASGGFTSYSWSNGATTSSITVNSSGNYTVQVTSSNGCSSTSVAFVVNASLLPTQNICVVGVDSLTSNIRLVWEKPLTTAIDSFYIYKESNVSNVYTQIGSRAYDSLSIWIDPISNPAVQSYRYKITAFDTCGVETPLSDFHKTIHLTINQGVGGAWNLIWSHYEGINFGSYKIYRGTSLSNMALLTTIQSNLNSYTDLIPPTGLVYYQIEIINPNNCSPTKSINYSSSKSNISSNGQNDLLVITSDYISIFPNPTTSKITVKSSLELIGKEFTIYDQLGKEVMSGLITSEETEIDLSNISEGVYLFKAGTEMQETFRIVKQ